MGKNQSDNLISTRAADLLISLRDGDATLLYLFFCRHGFQDPERACKELFMPRQRFQEACERLEMQGLFTPEGKNCDRSEQNSIVPSRSAFSDSPPAADLELPSYSAEDVSIRAGSDTAFAALINEAKLILGRPLSTPDLIKMLGIYDHFNLPAEVIMELMHFVADVYREQYQESRRPTVGAFEKEARIWVEREINDFDSAEQYISRWRTRHSLEGEIRDAMQISNREFTVTERRTVDQWLDWGFSAEMIAIAYDITVTNLHSKFSLKYMNRILQNWHENGLHSPADVREKDHLHKAGKPSGGSKGPGSINADLLQTIQQTINRKEQNHDP